MIGKVTVYNSQRPWNSETYIFRNVYLRKITWEYD